MKINYDRLFNVRIHNTKCLFHDICKLILVNRLKEKNPNTLIYTEYNPDSPNSSYPDIYMKKKDWTFIFEIQKSNSEKWRKQIIERYDLPKTDLIIIPIKGLPTEINELVNELDKYII